MAYTYLIGWRKLDKWYYGYRNRDNPESDLWVEYFTSSKYVKEFRELHGEPDVVRVHRVFPDKVSAMDDEAAKAHAFHDEVIPAMDALRAAADEAESIVDEDYWPLPCYSRMLFYTE